ncbi:EpsD family peptidyl-prolyl cis-trans isomerase [Massilia sp.]|uniref:EpsD family peptidyl-prolyl cis-trans isomerase n=1 Tax=Massilia sp. TaxID=1882437 RepID=UPI00289AC149|nr:EpsD family peptidyl-prolyl cis-trans isomerase [Massilia sp.]
MKILYLKIPSSAFIRAVLRRILVRWSGLQRGISAGLAVLVAGAALAGCSDDKATQAKPGQALASVNGEEITVLQLNEEIQRAGVPAAQQQLASKQLLQALIDRALLQEEAGKENLDRDPKVMQAIERARALIIAQAYMQKRVGDAGRPSDAEIQDYFDKNPQFFTERKQFTMNQLIMPATAVTPELRAAVDKAKSLEEVAVMLDARKIGYGRAQVTRSTADLDPQLSSKLLAMPKDQIFFAREGGRAMLVSVADVVDAPVTLAIAAPQIAQFLANRKNRELAQAEIGRLRAAAKIEYMNKELAPDGKTDGAAALARTAGPGLPAAASPGMSLPADAAAGDGSGATAATTEGAQASMPANPAGPAPVQAADGVARAAPEVTGAAAGAGARAGNGNGNSNGSDSAVDKAALERGVGGLR